MDRYYEQEGVGESQRATFHDNFSCYGSGLSPKSPRGGERRDKSSGGEVSRGRHGGPRAARAEWGSAGQWRARRRGARGADWSTREEWGVPGRRSARVRDALVGSKRAGPRVRFSGAGDQSTRPGGSQWNLPGLRF